jgi:dihydrofolate synthase/folylpolyglutamate synthase
MDKPQAMAFLDKLRGKGMSLGLERIEQFLASISSPQAKFNSVHIAGTNGKGSTAAFIERVLREAGFKTGLFTSPHLVRINERLQVNGKPISDDALTSLIAGTKTEMEKTGIPLTYFEFITALSFKHFAAQKVDFAIVETGMGGRLDATNVLRPAVSAITNVEREHEAFLGNTFEKIAAEKAGIIKEGIPVVTAEWKKPVLEVFRKKALEKNAQFSIVGKPFSGGLGLLGSFQTWNAALALAVVAELQKQGVEIGEKAIETGLLKAEWSGRFEIVRQNPTVVLDCAHNPGCCFALANAFREAFPGKRAVLVFGASGNKNAERMAYFLSPITKKVFVTSACYKGMSLEKLADCFDSCCLPVEAVPGVENALEKALSSAESNDVILVAGSCFLVGEAMPFFSSKKLLEKVSPKEIRQ